MRGGRSRRLIPGHVWDVDARLRSTNKHKVEMVIVRGARKRSCFSLACDDSTLEADWSAPSPVAFALIVEFGGSGGRVAGPIASKVAKMILTVLGDEVDDLVNRG